MKPLRAALLLLLVVPGTAQAATEVLVQRELPPASPRIASAGSTAFDLVGLHWQGTGIVRFRTQSVDGRWSIWRTAVAEPEDQPDRGTAEARRARVWRIGSPYWVGASSGLQYRAVGRVHRIRAYFVRTRTVGERNPRTLTAAGSPQIVSRSAWRANEAIRRGHPEYAPAVRFALVHHTAGANDYTPTQSASIVRAIETYHVLGNGWNDIGYNFLVDKYGQVFEGRAGGIERPVVGAHAEGFNRGSVGVALIGDYTSASITGAERAALVRLLAWRLDVAHVDPLSRVVAVSSGNPKFAAGTSVTLRAISGHRDTGPTSCPGSQAYAQLPSIAQAVAVTGLPKIYSPLVRGSLGGKVRFTARLSRGLPWTVTVTDALNRPVAQGTGTGASVDWIWDASAIVRGSYAYSISAGPTSRAATGTIGGPVAQLTLKDVQVDPAVVSPNGDGQGEGAVLRYRLGAAATVTATLAGADGAPIGTLFSEFHGAGPHTFVWKDVNVPDGHYRVGLSARAASGLEVTSAADFVVDRTLAAYTATPSAISPNGDGRLDAVALGFTLAAPATVSLEIRRGTQRLASLISGLLQPGAQHLAWDGRVGGVRLRDGSYSALLTVKDAVTTLTQELPLTIDTTPPRVQLVSLRRLIFRLSEAATLTLDVNGGRIVRAARAGLVRIRVAAVPRRLVVVATDAAGNSSRPIRRP